MGLHVCEARTDQTIFPLVSPTSDFVNSIIPYDAGS